MIDRSEKKSYCLINGSFSPETGRQLLMTLINDKIKFHQLNDWSHQERFGDNDPVVVKRIEELSQTREDIAQLIDEAVAMGLKLRIKSNIEIELTSE